MEKKEEKNQKGAEWDTDKLMRSCEINKKKEKKNRRANDPFDQITCLCSLYNIKYQRISTIVEQFNVKSPNRTQHVQLLEMETRRTMKKNITKQVH